jgi:Tol biopolymer transport system component
VSRFALAGAAWAALCLSVLVLTGCQARSGPQTQAMAPSARGSAMGVDSGLATASTTPSATATPRPTLTATPSATPSPAATETLTPMPTATATPAPRAVRLTSSRCCTQPFWSPDSQQVRFIDKPGADSPTGIWAVSVAEPGSEPLLVTERVEESLAAGDYLVETTENRTTIQRLSDGKRWTVPAGGRPVLISPDRTRIAWAAVDDALPPEQQVAAVWVANLDGSSARKVVTLRRGGLSGWISDAKLLVSGRGSSGSREQVLWALSLDDGGMKELARAERLRSPSLSPSGNWVAYYVTFGADSTQNGLRLARTDGSQQRPANRELFGSYQWRPCPDGCASEDERLLIVPFKPDSVFHELWELHAETGEARRLTDPATTPFKIANGDWRVSPDGRYVAFVESRDRNIWVIHLP